MVRADEVVRRYDLTAVAGSWWVDGKGGKGRVRGPSQLDNGEQYPSMKQWSYVSDALVLDTNGSHSPLSIAQTKPVICGHRGFH